MDWIPLLYVLIAWYTGGQLFRRLCYVELFQPLSTELQPHYGLIPDGRVWSFSYWHMLLVLLCNPVVVLHYADISAALCAFFYAVALIVYQFVCYCMFLYLLLHFSYRMWHIAKRYNRGSIVRHSFYFLRCYIRDLHEGHSAMPHLLHTSLLFCFLWGATRCVLSERESTDCTHYYLRCPMDGSRYALRSAMSSHLTVGRSPMWTACLYSRSGAMHHTGYRNIVPDYGRRGGCG